MRALLSSLICLLALSSAVVGCGDDDDEGRPRYRSNVSVTTNTPVADLDDDDLREICASFDAHVQANVDLDVVAYAACLPGAILSSADEATCEAELQRCKDDFPDPITINARLEDETVCFSSLRACNASVADLDTCINVNLDIVYDLFDSLTCGGTSDREAQEAADRANAVNVCADISAACNDFANVRGPD
jgi:hypothetical protein